MSNQTPQASKRLFVVREEYGREYIVIADDAEEARVLAVRQDAGTVEKIASVTAVLGQEYITLTVTRTDGLVPDDKLPDAFKCGAVWFRSATAAQWASASEKGVIWQPHPLRLIINREGIERQLAQDRFRGLETLLNTGYQDARGVMVESKETL
jgi:hypothetical protein